MPIATSFRHPLGNGAITGANDGDGYYIAQGFDVPNPAVNGSYHLGVDRNGEGGGDTDLDYSGYAIANGTIVATGYRSDFGNYVVIRHDLPESVTYWQQRNHWGQRPGRLISPSLDQWA